jgi:hypothetical protein
MSNPLFDFLGLRIGDNPFGGPDEWTIAVGATKLEVEDAEDQKNLSEFLTSNPDIREALTKQLATPPVPVPATPSNAPASQPAS